MSVVLIPVLLVIFMALAIVLALVRFQQERSAKAVELEQKPDVLRYVVPEGHDPAVIVAVLQPTAYDVSLAPADAGHEVLIAGVWRTSLDGSEQAALPTVRFRDEQTVPRGRSS